MTNDERKRLAYADRAETLEGKPIGSAAEYERKAQSDAAFKAFAADMPPFPTSLLAVGESPLADGTGRHSRKEIDSYRLVDTSQPLTEVVAGVQFASVPQLCAAYEYALSIAQQLYLLIDLKQHAWQPEQEVMREARQLLLAAGKDVP